MEEETNQRNGSPMAENARNGVSKKYRSHCCPNEDGLSKMPDSILLHILSFLPAKDVVKTSVLSQRWVYLWTSVPILDFIFPSWYRKDEISCCAITRADRCANFINFVKKTLIFHQCTHLKRFSLKCCFKKSDKDGDFVNTCVRFATIANVEELKLDGDGIRGLDKVYELPLFLFKNSTITKLGLRFCEFVPTGLINWKMLKSLTIGKSELSENLTQNILAGSPALECLELQAFYGFECLDLSKSNLKKLILDEYFYPFDGEYAFQFKIIAPKLRSLSILGAVRSARATYMLTSAYMLENCNLRFELEEYDDGDKEENYIYQATWIRALLQSLGHVNKLSLGRLCIEKMSFMAMEDLPFPQFLGKCLILEASIAKHDIPGIAHLLRSAPNLETLIINISYYRAYYDYDYDVDSKNYLTPQEGSSGCSLQHLKTIEIYGYEAGSSKCEFVIPFAQFLLKSARVLEKMVIKAQNLHLVQSRKAPQPCDAAQNLHLVQSLKAPLPCDAAQNLHLVQSLKAPLPCDAAQAWNRVTQKLLRFPRSSPQVEIIFSE